jgi:hypothetical protein
MTQSVEFAAMERDEDPLDDKVQAAAEEMEAELTDMEQRSEEVGEDIEETRQEWERKRDDSNVPGAEPRESEDQENNSS